MFGYIIYHRVDKYLAYDKNVNVEVVYKNRSDFPAVTICNQNFLRFVAYNLYIQPEMFFFSVHYITISTEIVNVTITSCLLAGVSLVIKVYACIACFAPTFIGSIALSENLKSIN